VRRLTFETEPPSNVGSYKFLNQACDHRDVRGKGALQRKILPGDCLNKLRSGRRQTIFGQIAYRVRFCRFQVITPLLQWCRSGLSRDAAPSPLENTIAHPRRRAVGHRHSHTD